MSFTVNAFSGGICDSTIVSISVSQLAFPAARAVAFSAITTLPLGHNHRIVIELPIPPELRYRKTRHPPIRLPLRIAWIQVTQDGVALRHPFLLKVSAQDFGG